MKKINESWFKHAIVLMVFTLLGLTTLFAQEIEVTEERVILKNGTARLYLSGSGQLWYQQDDASKWVKGITSLVNHSQAVNFRGVYNDNGTWLENFVVLGNGYVHATALATTSDSIYKEEISPLGSEFEKLMKINAKQYKLKADEKRDGKEKKTHYGFIAQELEEVYPDMVFTNEEGIKSIFYTELIPVLLEAVKAQQAQIEEQAALIADLDKRLEKIERKDVKELKMQ